MRCSRRGAIGGARGGGALAGRRPRPRRRGARRARRGEPLPLEARARSTWCSPSTARTTSRAAATSSRAPPSCSPGGRFGAVDILPCAHGRYGWRWAAQRLVAVACGIPAPNLHGAAARRRAARRRAGRRRGAADRGRRLRAVRGVRHAAAAAPRASLLASRCFLLCVGALFSFIGRHRLFCVVLITARRAAGGGGAENIAVAAVDLACVSPGRAPLPPTMRDPRAAGSARQPLAPSGSAGLYSCICSYDLFARVPRSSADARFVLRATARAMKADVVDSIRAASRASATTSCARLLSSPFLDELAGRRVLVKAECLQRRARSDPRRVERGLGDSRRRARGRRHRVQQRQPRAGRRVRGGGVRHPGGHRDARGHAVAQGANTKASAPRWCCTTARRRAARRLAGGSRRSAA